MLEHPEDAMTRGQAMQHLHALVNAYAAFWDEGHFDPQKKPAEPTTARAWVTDFGKWMGKPEQHTS